MKRRRRRVQAPNKDAPEPGAGAARRLRPGRKGGRHQAEQSETIVVIHKETAGVIHKEAVDVIHKEKTDAIHKDTANGFRQETVPVTHKAQRNSICYSKEEV